MIYLLQDQLAPLFFQFLSRATIFVSNQILDTLNHLQLQLVTKSRSRLSKQSTHTSPKLGQSHPTRSILMSNPILSRCIYSPSTRPCTHGQHDLFPHKTPRHIRIERDIHQKFSRRKEESSCNKWNLGRTFFFPMISHSCINPYNFRFHITRAEFTRAQSCSVGSLFQYPTILLIESGWVRTQHTLGIRFRSLELIGIQFIPIFVKFQM
mmetsp:Transcript_13331/g.19059  ORF Transcript_13331/g.19059 Transcript_13331/m.19059 type:complete len:209 (+) Transcript_13331:446-1072(+)